MLGQVQRPGTYRFPEDAVGASGLDLMQALGMAGGFTRLAAPSRVTIRRAGSAGQGQPGGRGGAGGAVERVDARLWTERPGVPSLRIHAGDVITVGERFF